MSLDNLREEYQMTYPTRAAGNDAFYNNLDFIENQKRPENEVIDYLSECLRQYSLTKPKSKAGAVLRFLSKPAKLVIPIIVRLIKNRKK